MTLPNLFKEHLKNQEDEGELKPLKDFWTDKNLDDGEKFLRDYILNKKFLENNDEHQILNIDRFAYMQMESYRGRVYTKISLKGGVAFTLRKFQKCKFGKKFTITVTTVCSA